MTTFFDRFFRSNNNKSPDFKSQESDSFKFPKIICRYDLLVLFNPDRELTYSMTGEDDEIDQIIDELREYIEGPFATYVADLFSNKVTVEIKNLRKGSIVGTILLVGYEVLSQYHDAVESLVLIRNQLESITHQAIRRQGIRHQDYRMNIAMRNIPHDLDTQTVQQRERPSAYSSIFFWYLLVMNILLIAAIVYLVYQATYLTYVSPYWLRYMSP